MESFCCRYAWSAPVRREEQIENSPHEQMQTHTSRARNAYVHKGHSGKKRAYLQSEAREPPSKADKASERAVRRFRLAGRAIGGAIGRAEVVDGEAEGVGDVSVAAACRGAAGAGISIGGAEANSTGKKWMGGWRTDGQTDEGLIGQVDQSDRKMDKSGCRFPFTMSFATA